MAERPEVGAVHLVDVLRDDQTVVPTVALRIATDGVDADSLLREVAEAIAHSPEGTARRRYRG